jgi:hypothetical protein
MKILIYIPIEDAVKGKVDPNGYWLNTNNFKDIQKDEIVQVSITSDEFARLCDLDTKKTLDVFDGFPEYKDLTLGEFQGWYSGLDDASKERYKELQNSTQDNKRNK